MVHLSKIKKPTLGCYSLLHFVWILPVFPFSVTGSSHIPFTCLLREFLSLLVFMSSRVLSSNGQVFCRNALQFGLTWCFYVIRLRLWAMRFIGSTWQQHCLSHWGFNGDHSDQWGTVTVVPSRWHHCSLQILIRKRVSESSLSSVGRGLSPTPWIRSSVLLGVPYGETCPFASTYLVINRLLYHRLLDTYFIHLILICHCDLFCCSNSSSYGHWEFLQYGSCLWHVPFLSSFEQFLTFCYGFSCIYPVPTLETAISVKLCFSVLENGI